MKERSLSIPELAVIGGTRAALGAGVGLILADKLNASRRKTVGWTLLAIGALSTIPIAMNLCSKRARTPVTQEENADTPLAET